MDFAVRYLAEVQKVDRQGVMRCANKYFTPGFYSVVTRPGGAPDPTSKTEEKEAE
jgi:hypothetical protein